MAWTLERIKGLIKSGIEESDSLDYKQCLALSRPLNEKKRSELSKDVSAFANHPGGNIIFGVVEETVNAGGRKVKRVKEIDEGYEEGEIDKAWLEDILPHLVSPPLLHLNVTSIQVTNGKYIYVVEIPRSPVAPHQSSDSRYYGRKGAKSVPLSHLEIEAIRMLGAPSGLKLHFRLGSTTGTPRADGFGLNSCIFHVSVRNVGRSIVRGVFIEIYIPSSNRLQIWSNFQSDAEMHEIEGFPYQKFFGEIKDQGNGITLYPDQETVSSFSIKIKKTSDKQYIERDNLICPDIKWRIHTGEGYREEGDFRLIDMYDELVVLEKKRF